MKVEVEVVYADGDAILSNEVGIISSDIAIDADLFILR